MPYISQRAAAKAAVTGVRNVRNDIGISYAIDPVDVNVNVHQARERSALVPDDSDVTSDTKDGVITLTGHVRTWAEHDAVVGAAWMALGVIEVRDELRLTGIGAGENPAMTRTGGCTPPRVRKLRSCTYLAESGAAWGDTLVRSA